MNLSHGDQILWLVYITIKNLDTKIRRSQKRLRMLLLGSIPIIHKWAENANNKNKDLKAKIYHIALRIMLQRSYPSFFFIDIKEIRC